VRVVLTGVSGQNAALRLHRAFRDAPDFCISSGLAGGLSEICQVNDVVVGRRVSWRGTTSSLAGDAQLVRTASACGAKVVNRFITVEKIAANVAQKEALASSGDVVEMESYFVMRAAAAAKIPAVAVRAISDAVDEDLPMDFSAVIGPRGTIDIRKLLRRAARSPRTIPGLVRFGMKSRRAPRALAKFLDRYLLALQDPRENAASAAVREAALA
jgi:adenosylhomocysteine nucleosidase